MNLCHPCAMGKSNKLPFISSFEKAHEKGEIVHAELDEPLPLSTDSCKYLSTFTDQATRLIKVAYIISQMRKKLLIYLRSEKWRISFSKVSKGCTLMVVANSSLQKMSPCWSTAQKQHILLNTTRSQRELIYQYLIQYEQF